MELQTAKNLIAHPDLKKANCWLDLGAGSGLFSRALAHFLSPPARIYLVDKSEIPSFSAENEVELVFAKSDFVSDRWPAGASAILMANALHYVKEQKGFWERIYNYLPEDGLFLLLEYDSEKANPWVPYPVSLTMAKKMAQEAGFRKITELNRARSTYQPNGIYSLLINK